MPPGTCLKLATPPKIHKIGPFEHRLTPLQHRQGGHGVRVRTREIWRKSAPDVATECSGETHHFFAADFFAFFGAGAAAAFFAIAEGGVGVVG